MKKLILISAIAFTGAAHAGTVTLEPSPCTSTYFCANVGNDAGESIDYISYSAHYGRLSAYIDGVLWDSGLWATLGQGMAPTNVPLYDGNNNVIYVSVTFAGGQVTGPCVQSGRVCVFPRAPVTIAGGTIVTP